MAQALRGDAHGALRDEHDGGTGGGAAGVTSLNAATGAVKLRAVDTVATIAALDALDASAAQGYALGSLVWVQSVGDYFGLRTAAATVAAVTIRTASNRAGCQWHRLGVPDPSNATRAFWSVDPTNGNDENQGWGATAVAADLVAVKTIGEVSRRMRGVMLQQNTQVRLLGSLASTDVNDWSTTTLIPNRRLTVFGVLGAATGPAGAVDNTLYSGTVTAYTDAGETPAATDNQLNDTGIPVSYTASGLLAAEVIFQRTSGTLVSWYAAADLGAKTVQVNSPCNDSGSATRLVLAPGDTYKAYQMPKIYGQTWGSTASQVIYDSVADNASNGINTSESNAIGRRRVWLTTSRNLVLSQFHVNCCFAYGGGFIATNNESFGGQILGGLFRGSGATGYHFSGARVTTLYWPCLRGCTLDVEGEGGYLGIEQGIEVQGCTGVALSATHGAAIHFTGANATGIIGKGNTSTLLSATGGSRVTWSNNTVSPPVAAGSSSSGTPIQIGGAAAQAVAALPIYPFDKAGVAPLAVGNGMYQT